MKLRNKILSAMMIVAASMSFVTISAFAASVTLTPSATEVKAGDTFTVDVATVDNPGVCAISLLLDTDSNFTLTGVTDKGLYAGKNFDTNYKNEDYALSWYIDDSFSTDNTAAGTAATLTFKVNDNAAEGEYVISTTTDLGVTMNTSFEGVDFGTTTLKIKVVGDEPKADYYAATLTWGEKAKANTGVKFNFSDSTDNKNKYAKVPFGDVTFEADSDVTVAVEVKNAPAGALTFTGAEWYLD
jgi:hypothetical protein